MSLMSRRVGSDLPAFSAWRVKSHETAKRIGPTIWRLNASVAAYEREKAVSGSVRGFSAPANAVVDFEVHRPAEGAINWRENLICPITGLNNRVRAAYHLFRSECSPTENTQIFLTEQTTPLYRHMLGEFPGIVGSEFLPGSPRGEVDKNGIRNEDLTRLSFPSGQFDAILAFDVLEHVPDYICALRECARVLRPGGRLYITVPFNYGPMTTVRAKILPDGTTDHLLAPEYHGDPIRPEGVLCYYHFGYSLLDDMRAAKFSDAYVCLYSDVSYGYLGVMQAIFVGVR